jgi:hypothetical protein
MYYYLYVIRQLWGTINFHKNVDTLLVLSKFPEMYSFGKPNSRIHRNAQFVFFGSLHYFF